MKYKRDNDSESQKSKKKKIKRFGVGYLWPRIGVLGGGIQTNSVCTKYSRAGAKSDPETSQQPKLVALFVQGPSGYQMDGLCDQ